MAQSKETRNCQSDISLNVPIFAGAFERSIINFWYPHSSLSAKNKGVLLQSTHSLRCRSNSGGKQLLKTVRHQLLSVS